MKLLKRQKGLPFLLALGVLFILSASFLAVQLWSDKDVYRGALHALEAPVLPPTMPKVVAPPPVKKSNRSVEPAAVPVVKAAEEAGETQEKKVLEPASEPVLEAVVEPSVPSIDKAQVQVSENKPAAAQGKVKVAEPVSPPKKKETPLAAAVKPEKNDVETTVAPKIQSTVKPAAKARKPRRKAKIEEIPTEIPPEWNWFSKPLKLNLEPGKARIERADSEKDIRLNETEKVAVGVAEQVKTSVEPVDLVVESAVENTVEPVSGEKDDEKASVSEPETSRPFMMALARMARIRQMRQSAETKGAVIAAPVEVPSPSMRRLGEALKTLCDKLDRQSSVGSSTVPESANQALEVVETADASASDAQNAAADVEQADAGQAVSGDSNESYVGSGSSFSQRVNMLLKSGLIRAE